MRGMMLPAESNFWENSTEMARMRSRSSTRDEQSPAIDAWSYFGPAFVLNLDRDVERMERVAGRLRRAGVAFERVPGVVVEGPGAGMRGCGLAHRRAWVRALETDCERFLVFEDDVVLRDDVARWLPPIADQLRQVEWDLFYLGLHLTIDGGPVTLNLGRVAHGYHAHAYVVQRHAVPRLLNWIDRYESAGFVEFDGFCDQSLRKLYANPLLAVQEPGYSHTQGVDMDRLQQYFERFGPFDRDDFRDHCREMSDARYWSF